MKKRVQVGWTGWRKVSGVICDRRVPAKLKVMAYKAVVRPAMLKDSSTEERTGGRDGDSRAQDVEVFFGSDQNG